MSSVCSRVTTGGSGIAIRTSSGPDPPGGPTVSQRKPPSSGKVVSARSSNPTVSVQKSQAVCWSWTHTLTRWMAITQRD